MTTELVNAVRANNALLFVGAGVSQNLGLPGVDGLISRLAEELGYDVDIFKQQGDFLALAEYYKLEKKSIGGLRSWMDREWNSGVDVSRSDIHRLIVELDFPIIYTTNWDGWLESAYALYGRDFVKIANVGDLSNGASAATTQIVKLHGDFDDDASIVLTESSYFERLGFESPLDVKLRADLLGRTVLYIGYSLSDINLRYMLYRLHRLWADSPYSAARPRSFIFLTRPNAVQERILAERGIIPIVSASDEPGAGLQQFLSGLLGAMRS